MQQFVLFAFVDAFFEGCRFCFEFVHGKFDLRGIGLQRLVGRRARLELLSCSSSLSCSDFEDLECQVLVEIYGGWHNGLRDLHAGLRVYKGECDGCFAACQEVFVLG